MMRINLSFPDMHLTNIVNNSKTETFAGIKPLSSKWLWFPFKYVKEYKEQIPNAINSGNLLCFDYNGNPLPFYEIACETSRLIRDVNKYPITYLWNIDIGTLLFCKICNHIDSLHLSENDKLKIIDDYNYLFNIIRNGFFKESIEILKRMNHNKIFTEQKINEIIICLESSDAV